VAREAEWKRHARNGEWSRIESFHLSPSERKSLLVVGV